MTWLKPLLWKKILTLALTFIIASFLLFSLSQVSYAQTDFWSRVIEFFGFSSGAPATGRSEGGAGRGSICAIAEGESNDEAIPSVIALMFVEQAHPDISLTNLDRTETGMEVGRSSESEYSYVGGRTVKEKPTFWFYIPYISAIPDEIRVARFSLLDSVKQLVWNELIAVELSQTPQLIEYQLPQNLEIDKLYNWHFSVICDPDKPSRDSVVRGWVQRVEPSTELQTALRNADLLQRPKYEAYARNGIWFESVNSLVESSREFPSASEVRGVWTDLLEYLKIPNAGQLDPLKPAKIVERKVA